MNRYAAMKGESSGFAANKELPGRRLPLEHWGFRAGRNGLELGSHRLADLAARFGTPFYLFDELRLRSNARHALETARGLLRRVRLLYSLKTNPHPRVLKILQEEGLGAETISSREIQNAMACGFPADSMVFNGPGKSDKDLALAVEHNVLVHVESVSEASALARIASTVQHPIRAGIRINPDVFEPRAQTNLRMGSRESVFGLNPKGEGFVESVRTLSEAQGIRLGSLSAHIGTGIISVEPFRRLIKAMVEVRSDLAQRGVEIDTLDLGGGFPVCSEVRYPEGAFDALKEGAALKVPPPEEIASFRDICKAVSKELEDEASFLCLLEPGRLLVSDTFHLITRVIRIKEESGVRFAILDAGRVQNALFVGRGYHEIIHIGSPEQVGQVAYTLVGPLCASFDVFARSRTMPALREGDVLAVLDIGAYNLSAQSEWSFDRAPVVAIAGNEAVRLELSR